MTNRARERELRARERAEGVNEEVGSTSSLPNHEIEQQKGCNNGGGTLCMADAWSNDRTRGVRRSDRHRARIWAASGPNSDMDQKQSLLYS
jgi:hypothetical protein